jgi:hypothetical protein
MMKARWCRRRAFAVDDDAEPDHNHGEEEVVGRKAALA